VKEARPQDKIHFKVLLKQQNLYKLEKFFWEVSDPQHANYGKFMTMEEIQQLVAPYPKSFKNTLNWLISSGFHRESLAIRSDYIEVRTSVGKAARLFQTSFAVYQSRKTGKERIRISGTAFIPAELKDDIHFVSGINELFDDTRRHPRPLTHSPLADETITPDNLKAYYGIPAGTIANNSKTTQGIAAFTDYYSDAALKEFYSHFKITNAGALKASGPDCLETDPDNCDQYESDLDVQYVTAIGLGAPTAFLAHGDGEWVLDWSQQLSQLGKAAPLINSVSYGWAELGQCDITAGCTDSQDYVNRTNVEFQKLGAAGITILISDGDDGAPSLGGASGNCPINTTNYCPLGGCDHTSTKCAEITFEETSNGSLCFFPMGLGSDACAQVLNDVDRANAALEAFFRANTKCKFNLEEDSDQSDHIYSTCECSALTSTTTQGLKVSGYKYDENNGAVFAADFPASSPYVTSVGATQFIWKSSTSVAAEVVASILTGAIITTGGGFSSFQPQPAYQASAVQAWLQKAVNLPPKSAFDTKYRGYPDIAFNGHKYLVYASRSQDGHSCPCVSLPVDGTSCSSPALAGLLSLVHDELFNAGKTQLGFLNPLLYQIAATNPMAFHDIVSGNTNCNRAYCCEYGYTATAGWDPTSGLGSPNYPQFLASVLKAKGVTK